LSEIYVHLGLGARAETLPDFAWNEESLARYGGSNASARRAVGKSAAQHDVGGMIELFSLLPPVRMPAMLGR
jgi:hypothetical protein